MRDGNNVDYAVNNQTSKCSNAGGKAQKSINRQAERVCEHSHAWPTSSTFACWKTAEKTGEKVKIVNNNKWLSIVVSTSYVA